MAILTHRGNLVRAALLFCVFAVVGCESSDERAQKHLEKGLALIEQGNPVQAILELRNALKLNKDLPEAHMAIASIRQSESNLQSAVGHYLKVIMDR